MAALAALAALAVTFKQNRQPARKGQGRLRSVTHEMNWPELITALAAAASGVITLWFNHRTKAKQTDLNARLALIQAETAAARERADFTAIGIAASRDERHAQLSALNEKVDRNIEANQAALSTAGEAVNLANNTNKKIADLNETIARQQSEILHLRQLQAAIKSPVAPQR